MLPFRSESLESARVQRRPAEAARGRRYAADNSLSKAVPNGDDASTAYYEYDKAGALVKLFAPSGTGYFEYAASGLVTRFAKTGKTIEFAYDGNLQRRAIVEDGVATYFLWDGLRLMETRNADGTLKARLTHGLARIEGIGSGVEIYVPSSSKRYYMLYDHRGSAHALLDESKSVVATRLYSAFGEIISETGTWPAEVPFAYQSNWIYLCDLPDGSPLYLSPTRPYHAGIGRFLQRDLVWYLNRYLYCWNAPVMLVDGNGLIPEYATNPLPPSPRVDWPSVWPPEAPRPPRITGTSPSRPYPKPERVQPEGPPPIMPAVLPRATAEDVLVPIPLEDPCGFLRREMALLRSQIAEKRDLGRSVVLLTSIAMVANTISPPEATKGPTPGPTSLMPGYVAGQASNVSLAVQHRLWQQMLQREIDILQSRLRSLESDLRKRNDCCPEEGGSEKP